MKPGVVVLFGMTSFLAAALLFSVQPMIGKMVLPVLGGTPAVWNTCLVYFQVMLLGGYLFAHGIVHTKAAERKRVSVPYLCVLALLLALGYVLQPIAIAPGALSGSIERNPAIVLLGILAISATLPLLVVSATAPLLQGWFALCPHPRASDPYFLYAASNAGSLAALVAYPLLIRAGAGLERAEPVLAGWISGAGDSGFLLRCCSSLVEPAGGRSELQRLGRGECGFGSGYEKYERVES